MRGGADGWVHLRMTAQAGISVFGRKRQVLGRNLACGDILVLSDQFQFSGRGYMQYVDAPPCLPRQFRSEEHTSELQSLMRISYAVFCLKKKQKKNNTKQKRTQ